MAVPPIYVDRSTAGEQEVSEDTDRELCGGLPLVVLALSRPEKALPWLVSQLPRYSFCGICGNELAGLALVA